MRTPVLKQIGQIAADALAPEQEADIQLVVDDSLDLLQSCKEFAVIVSQSVCPNKCYTTGDGLKTATVREEATVTLHARDKDDRECTEPIQTLLLNWFVSKMVPQLNVRSKMRIEANT